MRALSYIILLGGQGLTVALLTGCPKSESAATSTDGGSTTPTASASQVNLAPLDTSTPTASTSAGPTAPVATLGGGGGTPTIPSGLVLKALDGGLAAIPTTTTTATASATPTAQAHFKQCCSALHKQSQQQTPQAAQFAQAATMCDGLAAAMATAPQMPQMDQVKMLLQGVQLPPVCQGL